MDYSLSSQGTKNRHLGLTRKGCTASYQSLKHPASKMKRRGQQLRRTRSLLKLEPVCVSPRQGLPQQAQHQPEPACAKPAGRQRVIKLVLHR